MNFRPLTIASFGLLALTSSLCWAQPRTSLFVNQTAAQPSQQSMDYYNAAAGGPPLVLNAATAAQNGQVIAGLPGVSQVSSNDFAASGFAGASWTYTPVPPPRVLRVHDLITVRVDQTAQVQQTGTVQSRKNASLDMVLTDWIRLVGIDTVKPSPQKDGDQRIAGQDTEVFRANSDLRTRESMTFNITTEISDIRPNGLLVLSGRNFFGPNDNGWELCLSGTCRPQDVGPDNVILSRDIFELKITKNETGQVRDAYARGWVTKLFSRFKPF